MADAARTAALEVLRAVRVEDAYANLALPHALARHGLTGRGAAFATELAAGTLRRQGTYDAVLEACTDRPLRRVQAKVLDVLRLGTHQLLGMRVPTHAAISTSVDLARARGGQRTAGFVNAVLRRVARADLDAWVRRLAPDREEDPLGFAALAHAHPRWVVEAFSEALAGRLGDRAGAEELEALLAADNDPPRVTLVARPGLAPLEELVAAGAEPAPYSPYAAVLPAGDPGALPAVAEGRSGVQDEGSQLVALALAGAPVDGEDHRWLDTCAGPGGKAALLAALAGGTGAGLLAAELQEHRAALVARAARASGSGLLGVVTADGTQPAWPDATFDRVLLDAPCTGLGALRRRPEARWRRAPRDLDTLVPLQRALLDQALTAVRPGGVVLYATCSPVLSETVGVVETVRADRDDVVLEDAAVGLPGGPQRYADARVPALPGAVQLWPHRHGTDAMFLALLRRTGR